MLSWSHCLSVCCVVLLFACERVEKDGRQLGEKALEKTHELVGRSRHKLQEAVEKVFPAFDTDTADTENNKAHFRQLVRVPLTADVKNIYAAGDAIGIDAKYALAFSCSPETAEKIRITNALGSDTFAQEISSFYPPYAWWDEKRVSTLKAYSWSDGAQYYRYFWYDSQTQEGWFLDFDM